MKIHIDFDLDDFEGIALEVDEEVRASHELNFDLSNGEVNNAWENIKNFHLGNEE